MADAGRDYVGIALEYARGAVRDRTRKRHCKWVRLACKRHLDDLKRWSKEGSPYYFDDDAAVDVCDFIEKLPHVEGSWPTPTITLEPWQVFILVVVFGWRRSDSGNRRFGTAYIEVARKNAKSTLSAAVALYCLTCEGEPGPQVIIGARTGDQAQKVFKPARAMAKRTAALCEAFDLEPMARSIVCHQNDGFIQTINANSESQDGWNPHLTILDELHAHKNRDIFDVMRSARGARKNPLGWYITTAGSNMMGVCYEQRQYATKILEGIFEADHYFAIIFSLDETRKGVENHFDEKRWIKANPNLGVSVSLDELREYAKDAHASPASEAEFKTKRCNLWINAAQQWLNLSRWDACGDTKLDLEDYRAERCWIGADLADKDDMSAVAIVFDMGRELHCFGRYYMPEELVQERMKTVGTQLQLWARDGHVILTPGDWMDHNAIEADIREWCARFDAQRIRFDQYGGSQAMAARMFNDGYAAEIEHKNLKNTTDPAKELEARINVGRLRHDANPAMRWMVSNAVVTRKTDGSLMPKKETGESPNKIDGVDALVMAIGGWLHDQHSEPQTSVYNERGIMAI